MKTPNINARNHFDFIPASSFVLPRKPLIQYLSYLILLFSLAPAQTSSWLSSACERAPSQARKVIRLPPRPRFPLCPLRSYSNSPFYPTFPLPMPILHLYHQSSVVWMILAGSVQTRTQACRAVTWNLNQTDQSHGVWEQYLQSEGQLFDI